AYGPRRVGLRRRVSRVRLRTTTSATYEVSSALVICQNNSRNPSVPLGPVRVISEPSFRHAHGFVLPLKADIRASLTGPRVSFSRSLRGERHILCRRWARY